MEEHVKGARIERDSCVGEVSVVDEREVTCVFARELRHRRTCSVYVELNRPPARERRTAVARDVEQTNAQMMGAQDGVRVGRRLHHRGRLDLVVRDLQVEGKLVQARLLQPDPRPRPQVASGLFLQSREKIREGGVGVGVALEIGVNAIKEGLLSQPRSQLFEDRARTRRRGCRPRSGGW